GLGVDGWIMGRAATQLTLVERLKELCEALRHNYGELGAPCPTTVVNSDCETFLARGAQPCDIIYIDPARRDEQSRVFKIEDCSPDILSLKQQMFDKAPTVIAKLSPMVDIGDTVRKIPEISEIHVVSIHNECKEVLVVMQRKNCAERVRLIAADIPSGVGFEMDYGSEQEASALVADRMGKYLFQPCKAVLKLGAFRTLSREYGLGKLETSTHLYTSDTLPDRPFPGRTFTVTEVLDFSSSSIKTFSRRHHRCNLLALNMPADTATLRSRMGIKEGGDTTTFVCATAFGPKIIVCEPLLRPGEAPTGF
ncbi:MAG: hypothetical protein HUJ91_04600, partial [Bacteroidales bacterium]|nr:hypothetical protein [Bacteroidales bacterium]